MFKVFLIGFVCVALTHQASIGDSLKEGLVNAKSLVTGQQGALTFLINKANLTLQNTADGLDSDAGSRKKRQFQMFDDLMSE